MKEVVMLRGLPASGKSTYARELAALGYVRVNKDDLRGMLHDGKHSKGNEKQVLAIRDAIIVDSLERGRSVVIDDTNFHPMHEVAVRELALAHGASFRVDDRFLAVPLEECIARDLKRCNSVGERVIRQMHRQYVKLPVVPYPVDPALPTVVLCDIDGTLAHMGDRRSPYDWARVGDDDLDGDIAAILGWIPHRIILLSGRDEVCRPETEVWLTRHAVRYEALYMRPAGDVRKDSLVKRELFDQHIRGQFNVAFVLDDRDQVVRMWRYELGLKVLQVADGDF
jgi:predicted kinase